MLKDCVKTVHIGEDHLKRRIIMRSWTRFEALIRAVLTSPGLHKAVQSSSINGERSMQKQ